MGRLRAVGRRSAQERGVSTSRWAGEPALQGGTLPQASTRGCPRPPALPRTRCRASLEEVVARRWAHILDRMTGNELALNPTFPVSSGPNARPDPLLAKSSDTVRPVRSQGWSQAACRWPVRHPPPSGGGSAPTRFFVSPAHLPTEHRIHPLRPQPDPQLGGLRDTRLEVPFRPVWSQAERRSGWPRASLSLSVPARPHWDARGW